MKDSLTATFILLSGLLLSALPFLPAGAAANPYYTGAAAQPGGAPDNTLILRLKMDEGTGTSVDDATANNNDFTGTFTWNGSGKSGSGDAIDFTGNPDGIDSDATVTFGTNLVTVTFWLNADATSGTYILAESGPQFFNASFPHSWVVYIDTNTIAGGVAGAAGSNGETRTESVAFSTTATWVHVAVVLDNSSATGDVKIYLDGSEASTSIVNNTKNAAGTFAAQTVNIAIRDLGTENSGPALWFSGLMDDFRVYDGELDSSEIDYVLNNPDE